MLGKIRAAIEDVRARNRVRANLNRGMREPCRECFDLRCVIAEHEGDAADAADRGSFAAEAMYWRRAWLVRETLADHCRNAHEDEHARV